MRKIFRMKQVAMKFDLCDANKWKCHCQTENIPVSFYIVQKHSEKGRNQTSYLRSTYEVAAIDSEDANLHIHDIFLV